MAHRPSAEIKAEISRLGAKLSASDDADIRLALEAKIGGLEGELAESVRAELLDAGGDLASAPATEKIAPSDIEATVRRARVLLGGGKRSDAAPLIEALVATGSTHPDIAELQADFLLGQKKPREAFKVLKAARKAHPTDKRIDRKLAEVSLLVTDDAEFSLRSDFSDSVFLSSDDIQAKSGWAALMTLIAPGSGHIVLGRTVAGFAILITWLLCIIYLTFEGGTIRSVFTSLFSLSNAPAEPGRTVREATGFGYFCLALAGILHLGAIIGVGVLAKEGQRRTASRVPQRPKPPVDMPFE